MTTEYAIMILTLITLVAFVLNLPFGYLRGGTKKFSFLWWLYIHLPIPFIIALRLFAGFGYEVVPIILAAAIVGQLLGSRIYNLRVS
ncbi:MAG TPA: hypothetical protein VJM57_01405 [Thermodesulfobacteriota bacterium]|nr:hypothetical protein [Thermodesulfobacteriota bacterium]